MESVQRLGEIFFQVLEALASATMPRSVCSGSLHPALAQEGRFWVSHFTHRKMKAQRS